MSFIRLDDGKNQLEKIRQDFRHTILFFRFGAAFAAFELTASEEQSLQYLSLAKVRAVVLSFSF